MTLVADRFVHRERFFVEAARAEFRTMLLDAIGRDCATPEEAQAECELVLATAFGT